MVTPGRMLQEMRYPIAPEPPMRPPECGARSQRSPQARLNACRESGSTRNATPLGSRWFASTRASCFAQACGRRPTLGQKDWRGCRRLREWWRGGAPWFAISGNLCVTKQRTRSGRRASRLRKMAGHMMIAAEDCPSWPLERTCEDTSAVGTLYSYWVALLRAAKRRNMRSERRALLQRNQKRRGRVRHSLRLRIQQQWRMPRPTQEPLSSKRPFRSTRSSG
jgi:hypothetical protein